MPPVSAMRISRSQLPACVSFAPVAEGASTPVSDCGTRSTLARFASRCALEAGRKLQVLREMIREQGLVRTGWYCSTDYIPGKVWYYRTYALLGANWTEFVPGVCLGSQPTRWGRRVLQILGIRAALNMREDFDDLAHGVAFPFHLQPALQTPDLAEQIRLGLEFIHDQRVRGEKVYIHCCWGFHRGGGMAIAYLISVGWSLAQAKEHLFRRRRGVSIWPSREHQVLKAVEAFQAKRRTGTGQ